MIFDHVGVRRHGLRVRADRAKPQVPRPGWPSSQEWGPIETPKARPVGWRDTPLPLFIIALLPAILVLPLRFFLFADANPFTLVLLGPALEESLKLAALVLALIGAALALPRGKDPENALRYWLFLLPLFVGFFYGLMEGIVVYPGDSHLNFTLRELAHASFTALGLAAALWVWRELAQPYGGIAVGFGVAWIAHVVFNSLAYLSQFTEVTFQEQAVYGLVVFAVALVALSHGVGREPASRETASLLAIQGRGLRT